ncbi:MAG: AAA family ATPase [Sinobacteraceae bacterium]|nr:AAA family ATPase [Nevskiaceae bacterium]MCP5339975.1 AAA family ATPase [Nevskiaceae bacterium]MCP5360902.1 AAA family ATPase [Nevskiaceae bacterium]MCP5467437.1 AAA family ATPase [Nevskiaceae bacterium]MCP5470757.1 AAA family ATPase [Nevskiaceae bacterium]
MYLSFFGLNDKPFAITPDPRYLFLSERHSEALAHLVYGINEAGGFIQLTGEVGTGKTTTIRSLLAQIPKNAEVALILNPRISATEFLLTICEELGIGVPDESIGSVKDLVDILNAYLLRAHARGQRVVVVVDEAHLLEPEVLEQVRLLTNLETATHKLLQIILIGQPELRELLDRNDLRQLAQRITGRYHLNPLSKDETAAYVRHRLRVAGSTSDIFSPMALLELYRLAGGVPRLINIIADRALLGAYTQDRHRITGYLVRDAAREVFGKSFAPLWMPWALAGGAAAALLIGLIALWQALGPRERSTAIALTTPPTADDINTSKADAGGSPATNATAAAGDAGPASAVTPLAAAADDPGATANSSPVALQAAVTNTPAALDALLAQFRNETDPDNAFNKLFALWNARYVVGRVDACTQAAQQGLECYVQRGTFADLRLFNRPAILAVNDSRGRSHQIVLAALDDQRAIVSLGGAPRAVSLGELSRLWFGDFVLLWRPGGPDVKTLSFGMRGNDVRRLRESLRRLRGLEPELAPNSVYDAELVKLVEDFQRQHRLTIDGIAGIQTLVVLDTALATPGSPLLDAAPRLAQGG